MVKVVPVSDAELAKQKTALEARCITATVTGEQPIRDAVSRESVEQGGTVRLDPQGTILDHLVRSGAITLGAVEAKA